MVLQPTPGRGTHQDLPETGPLSHQWSFGPVIEIDQVLYIPYWMYWPGMSFISDKWKRAWSWSCIILWFPPGPWACLRWSLQNILQNGGLRHLTNEWKQSHLFYVMTAQAVPCAKDTQTCKQMPSLVPYEKDAKPHWYIWINFSPEGILWTSATSSTLIQLSCTLSLRDFTWVIPGIWSISSLLLCLAMFIFLLQFWDFCI